MYIYIVYLYIYIYTDIIYIHTISPVSDPCAMNPATITRSCGYHAARQKMLPPKRPISFKGARTACGERVTRWEDAATSGRI